MSDLPPEAAEWVDLGAAAIETAERELGDRPIRQYPLSWRRTLALAVIKAAAPAIRADERESVAGDVRAAITELEDAGDQRRAMWQAWIDHFLGALAAAVLPHLPPARDDERAQVAHSWTPETRSAYAAGRKAGRAEGAAAERERIRQLGITPAMLRDIGHDLDWNETPETEGYGRIMREFADLLEGDRDR
jgi:hypothetical protein